MNKLLAAAELAQQVEDTTQTMFVALSEWQAGAPVDWQSAKVNGRAELVKFIQSQKLAYAAELQEELLDFARDVLGQYGYEGRSGGMSTLEWAESIIKAAEQRERNKEVM